MSDTALSVVQRSFTMSVRAESWLDGQLLADGIPIADGSESRDRSLAIPETVSLTVPRRDRGYDWDPGTDPEHPLAAYGQMLRIDYGIDVGGQYEWINRGWFLITDSSTSGDTVTVNCAGLLSLIDEAKLVSPFQPSSTDTLASVIRGLVEPALTCSFDGSLTDRAVPLGLQWDSDRLGAVTDVLNSWGAEGTVTEDGYLYLQAVSDSGSPVLSLTDDGSSTSTVVQWEGSSSRDGAFNVVVAQGEDSSGNQITGVAYDGVGDSPYRYGGPFNPLPVPYFYQSSLLTTVDQCRTAARSQMTLLRRQAFRRLAVTMVPHPGLVTGDIVSVTGAGLTNAPCAIESLSLPYAPGSQSLTVRVL
ncbi:hypothetical protein ACIRJO_02945 [Streptomyces sp. NPDC102394]|uniref:hypothetical protein n=1 Tax=Streptomyces sp. NPDC102394 TaxID=3366167 RepID=UPI0037FF1FA7